MLVSVVGLIGWFSECESPVVDDMSDWECIQGFGKSNRDRGYPEFTMTSCHTQVCTSACECK